MCHKLRHTRQGFTLLELAVVLLLVGLMAGFALKVAPAKDCQAETAAQLVDIRRAIRSYVATNSQYPMPARRNVGVTSTNFGVAVTSTSDADIDNASSTLIGALPIVSLGLSSSYAADCWGNKFTYAVTTALTNQATYRTSSGGITIRHASSLVDVTTTAAYIVHSHGKDALEPSAKNYSGVKKQCSVTSRFDTENCDLDALYVVADYNPNLESANFYDDLLIYGSKNIYAGCLSTTKYWGAGCNASTGAMTHGQTLSLSSTDATYTGTVQLVCNNGVIQMASPTCTP